MPIKDSNYTNPDKLRLLYLNPRALTNNLPEESRDRQQGDVIVTGQTASTPLTPNNLIKCPAVGQNILLKNSAGIYLEKVENTTVKDFAYNPYTGTHHQIIGAERFSRIECVRVRTFDGAEKICSLSAPIIRSFSDTDGLAISEIINQPEIEFGAVTCINFEAFESEIESILSVGMRDVIKFELADGHIFWTGTTDKLIAEHNAKTGGGNNPNTPLE